MTRTRNGIGRRNARSCCIVIQTAKWKTNNPDKYPQYPRHMNNATDSYACGRCIYSMCNIVIVIQEVHRQVDPDLQDDRQRGRTPLARRSFINASAGDGGGAITARNFRLLMDGSFTGRPSVRLLDPGLDPIDYDGTQRRGTVKRSVVLFVLPMTKGKISYFLCQRQHTNRTTTLGRSRFSNDPVTGSL